MKKVVVDSSVAIKWLNFKDEDFIEQSDKLMADSKAGKIELLMPELAKCEVGNALLNKGISLSQALGSLATYYSFPVRFIPLTSSLGAVTMEIAQTSSMTYYDAVFISVAIKENAVLVTANPKHHKKYKGKDVTMIQLENYT